MSLLSESEADKPHYSIATAMFIKGGGGDQREISEYPSFRKKIKDEFQNLIFSTSLCAVYTLSPQPGKVHYSVYKKKNLFPRGDF